MVKLVRKVPKPYPRSLNRAKKKMTKTELFKLVSKVSMFSTLAPLVLTMDEMPIEELPQELRKKTENVKKDLDSLVDELREYIGNKGELPTT